MAPNPNHIPTSTPEDNESGAKWDNLAEQQSQIEKQYEDDLLNIEDMLKSGRINEEQAAHYRAEIFNRAEEAKKPQLTPESQKYLEDEMANIEDMLKSGRIDEEQAVRYRKEVEAKVYDGNQVEASEISLQGVELEVVENQAERLNELKDQLENLRPELAELYAKNRRLINIPGQNAEFDRVKGEYSELLDEYLRIKGQEAYRREQDSIAQKLEVRIEGLAAEINQKLNEFINDDSANTAKTQEEIGVEKSRLIEAAEQALRDEYGEMIDEVKDKINTEFLADLIAEETKLEEETVDKLDNGTICRKFVNKIINSKILRNTLVAAAVAGLVVTGVGVAAGMAAGAMTAGLSFTAGGVAAGAAKGAFMGGLMSRQNSKNSAIQGFANEEDIKAQLGEINLENQDEDTTNVANWLLGQYSEANASDRSSNRKRTLVAAGIGAALGALASGAQFNNVSNKVTETQDIIGYKPVEVHADVDIDNVYHKYGYGLEEYCVNEAHLVSSPEEFYKPGGLYDIIIESGGHHGLTEGSNGGWTYEGTLDQWLTSESQATMRDAIQTAAERGVIPSYQTGGEAIYGPVTDTSEIITPNLLQGFITRELTGLSAAGAVGSVIGGVGKNKVASPAETPESQDVKVSPEERHTNLTEMSDADLLALRDELGSQEEISGMSSSELFAIKDELERQSVLSGMSNAELLSLRDKLNQQEIENSQEATPDEVNDDGLLEVQHDHEPQQSVTEMTPDELFAIKDELERRKAIQGMSDAELLAIMQNLEQRDFAAQVKSQLGDLDAESLEILADSQGYVGGGELEDRLINWWNNLSQDKKDAIIDFEKTQTDSNEGKTLRMWMRLSGISAEV